MTQLLDLAQTMRVYAYEAIALAQEEFDITLDFSEASLHQSDAILVAIHDALPRDEHAALALAPTLETWLEELSVYWGAYLGEVILQRWGGQWTLHVPPDLGETAALQIGRDVYIYPISKVYKFLVEGTRHKLTGFYHEVNWRLTQFSRFDDWMSHTAIAG